ncbi:hypothetical protein C5O12_00275 [Akkermansia muciniphila]|nr:hypothetical protein C1O59_00275 [Akkermansia muciniphila]QHV20211.1 hypothetical protein C5O12_00275 [Akkermansia muciniphila]QHV26938.1 hypothetical protein C5O14_00275 [Akkermansia muciniphila]
MTKQPSEKDSNALVKHSLFIQAVLLSVLFCLPQCSRKPLLPEYTPLCSGMVPGEHTAHRALRARENRIYRVGPKGGVYYINSHNKKVYIKSRRVQ